MATKRDYYQVLGVNKSAAESEIKKAYRKLARQYHPDVNPGDKAAEDKFKEIQEAYDVLGNKEKRQKYDQYGHLAFEPGFEAGQQRGGPRQQSYWHSGGSPFGGGARRSRSFEDFGDLGDIFGDIFSQSRSRARRPSGPRKGEDMEYSLEVDFVTAAKGGSTQIAFGREAACEACNGSGARQGSQPQICPQCGGKGMVNVVQGPLQFSQPCPRCQGVGKVNADPCPTCHGRGTAHKQEKVQVKIPPGVNDGSRIRLAGKGKPGVQGGPPGNLYIVIKTAKHPYFRREGDDIYLDVPIGVSEALLGAKVVIPTIDGKTNLTIPPGIQSGQKLRLGGKGAYHLKGGDRGDQFAVIKIVPPKQLDEKAKELIEQFAQAQQENPRADVGW